MASTWEDPEEVEVDLYNVLGVSRQVLARVLASACAGGAERLIDSLPCAYVRDTTDILGDSPRDQGQLA